LSQRRDQGELLSFLHDRPVSLPEPAPADPPDLRRLRSAAHVLGYRPLAPAVPVPPGDHALHRGAPVARGRGPRMGHGARRVRVARLAGLNPYASPEGDIMRLEFYDPCGALEVTQPFAARLDTLEGKRI